VSCRRSIGVGPARVTKRPPHIVAGSFVVFRESHVPCCVNLSLTETKLSGSASIGHRCSTLAQLPTRRARHAFSFFSPEYTGRYRTRSVPYSSCRYPRNTD